VTTPQAESLFQGRIAEDYRFLGQICPEAAEISESVGRLIGDLALAPTAQGPEILEIGTGTGVTTHFLLHYRPDAHIVGIDNSGTMLNQAREAHQAFLDRGVLELHEIDALNYLKAQPDDRFDAIASAYVLHNFLDDYRNLVLAEIHRTLKPGGVFINGDRYTLDDPKLQLQGVQLEVRHWFEVFKSLNRLDLLEEWIVHLLSDESEEHQMPLGKALERMANLGFVDVNVLYRKGANALVQGLKPWP
jgi:ubiquinone/menaquinone biosynthesis C-methylase UbiE